MLIGTPALVLDENPRMEKLTREELFELVWTTPMNKLAARFGVSGVALAKTCARFNIPRPAQGHWQRLALGTATEKPQLPPSDDGNSIVLATVPLAKVEGAVAEPIVAVSERRSDPHPAVQWLQKAFASAKSDEHGRLTVRHVWGVAFSARPAHVPRALRIMDALAKGLVARGHEIVAGGRGKDSPIEFLVRPQDAQFAIELEERLDRRPHTLSAEEKQQKARGGYFKPPQYDYFPDGALRVMLKYTHYKYVGQKSWSDTKTRRLDDVLGHAVLAIEQAAHLGRVEHEEHARHAEQWRIAEMKRLRVERLQWYRGWLARDLDRMLDDHERAVRVQTFLDEYDRRLPAGARTEVATRWCEAIRALAHRLDPMNRLTEVAKELEPSDEVLARLVADGSPS